MPMSFVLHTGDVKRFSKYPPEHAVMGRQLSDQLLDLLLLEPLGPAPFVTAFQPLKLLVDCLHDIENCF